MTRKNRLRRSLAPRLRFLADQITEKGLCTRPGADPGHWFPEKEPGGNAATKRRAYEQAAAARCFGCPVRAECQEAALAEEADLASKKLKPHGIRAGLAPWVRADMIRNDASESASENEETAA
ncbi:WhiB family transcriptional regulator [Streptosporangium sp. NPDC049248]|uniref:WhiB family transcriptional regulator n=1 Tax=Streptosporangium sp. NPDC049248 TaxID=3155651 RepID=UPI00342A3F94